MKDESSPVGQHPVSNDITNTPIVTIPAPQENETAVHSHQPKSSKFVRILLFTFITLLTLSIVVTELIIYLSRNKIENIPTLAQLPMPTMPIQNNVVVFTQSSGDRNIIRNTITFYDISTKTQFTPKGDFACNQSCSIKLYDWSPDGLILPFAIFNFGREELETNQQIYYYDKSANSVSLLYENKSADTNYSSVSSSLIFGNSDWLSTKRFKIDDVVFDLDTKTIQIDKSLETENPDSQIRETLYTDRLQNIDITYKQITTDTGIKKFQGFFGPNTIQDVKYEMFVDDKLFLETTDIPQGAWSGYVTVFKPTPFRQALDIMSDLEADSDNLDETALQERMYELLGPQGSAIITLYPYNTVLDKKVIEIENDHKWISYDILPRFQSTKKLLVFQSEFVQIPIGKSRLIEIDIDKPDDYRIIREYDVPGMSQFSGMIDHEMMTQDGNYLIVSTPQNLSETSESTYKIELLNLDSGLTETVCNSNCLSVKLHTPYKIYKKI